MLKAFTLDRVFHFISCNNAACVGLSQWKQNDSASCRKQIAFPSAHNMFLPIMFLPFPVEMRRKRTSRAQKILEGTSKHHELDL